MSVIAARNRKIIIPLIYFTSFRFLSRPLPQNAISGRRAVDGANQRRGSDLDQVDVDARRPKDFNDLGRRTRIRNEGVDVRVPANDMGAELAKFR